MLRACERTVSTPMPRASAICALELFCRNSTSTSPSRGVSSGSVTCTSGLAGEELELKASRREVDRVSQVAHLSARGEACAGAECQQLSRLDARETVPEQYQVRLRVVERELAHLGVVAQRADVEDQHAWAVHAKHALEARGRDIPRNNRNARVGFESSLKAQREKVLEAGDGDCDRRVSVHVDRTPTRASISPIGTPQPKGEQLLTLIDTEKAPPKPPSGTPQDPPCRMMTSGKVYVSLGV